VLASSTVAGLPSTDDIGVVSLLLFWGMVELGVGMIAICLPILRPLFAGWSVEKIVQSVRSAISLRSLGSHQGSHGSSRRSQGHTTNQNADPKVSGEKLVEPQPLHFPPENEQNSSQIHVKGGMNSYPMDSLGRGEIYVERDFHIENERL
jgi:hypothetical protein